MTDALWQLGGWTMLHFLWAGAIAALIGGLIRFACRRAAPAVRYAVSLATLAALVALPVAIGAWLAAYSPVILAGRDSAIARVVQAPNDTPSQDDSAIYESAPRDIDLADAPIPDDAVTTYPQPSAIATSGGHANPSPSPARLSSPQASLRGRGINAANLVPYLPYAWLLGAPLTFALLATGLIGSERLRRRSSVLTAGPVFDACERLRKAMRIARRVSVAACEGLAQPVLVGIVRPLILLPASALSGWTPEELEMVLVHELAHVRRWDNLVNLLQRIVESLLFFHPAVWLVSRQVRRDREECCDAIVVSRTAQPQRYAELLVSIASVLPRRQAPGLAVASAMADHPLAGRIRRILKLEDEPMCVSRRTLFLAIAIPALVALGLFSAGINVRSAGAEEPTSQSKVSESTSKPVESTAGNKGDAENQEKTAEPDWEDPAVLKRLFSESKTNPLEKVVYDISEAQQYPDQFTDALDGARLDPYGPQLPFKWNWIEKDKRIEITAPKEAHEWFRNLIAEFNALGQADRSHEASEKNGSQRDTLVDYLDAAVEVPRVQSEIRRLNSLIDQENKNLANIEVFKQLALQKSRSPQEIEKAIDAMLKVDGKIVEDQHRIADLQSAIEKLRPDGRGPAIETLEKERETAEREAKKYLEKRRAEIREGIAKMPNESLRTAIIEHQIRHKAATENLRKYEQDLKGANRKLAELEEQERQRTTQESSPAHLQPGDEVKIEVVGAFPEQPIDGLFVIEPQGTVALGATYGRVKIAGLSLIEAEKAVTEKLKAILTDVQVQITLPPGRLRRGGETDNWPPRAGSLESYYYSAKPKEDEATYLYDGKTFDEWRSLWKNELNPERRSDAIAAFAAFARTGYGKEAAEAIFDVAGQYDFSEFDENAEGKLKERVLNLLTRGGSSGVPATDWLPLLMERLEQDAKKWRPLTWWLLYRLQTSNPSGIADPQARKLLIEFASNPKFAGDPQFDSQYLALALLQQPDSEVPLEEEVVRLTKAALTSEDSDKTLNLLRILEFRRLDLYPEQFDLLMHEDPDVQLKVRQYLPHVPGSARGAVADRLLTILDSPERTVDHADAVRALGVLIHRFGPRVSDRRDWDTSDIYKKALDRLGRITREGPDELRPAAIVAIGIENAREVDGWMQFESDMPEELREAIEQARDKIEEEAKKVMGEDHLPAKSNPAMGFGGEGGRVLGGEGGGIF